VNRRRSIQRQHERAVVADFLEWLRRRGRPNFVVVAEPRTPEAIIQSPRRKSWIEVVDAFWNPAWARDVYSYATPGEKHAAVGRGPHAAPDATFARNFSRAVSKKLSKTSYATTAKQYGPGYLLVNIEYPFFDVRAYRAARAEWRAGRPWPSQGCFREIYTAFRAGNRRIFRRWEP
jgi:hypothetical protein